MLDQHEYGMTLLQNQSYSFLSYNKMLLHGLFNVSDSFASYSENVCTHFIFDLIFPWHCCFATRAVLHGCSLQKQEHISSHSPFEQPHTKSKALEQPTTDSSFEVSKLFFSCVSRNVSNPFSVGAGSS